MIQRPRPGTLRRRVGFMAVASLMTTAAFVARAAVKHDAGGIQASSAQMDIASQTSPNDQGAVKNEDEGTVVMLLVLVGPDGNPIRVKAEGRTNVAPEMIKAVTNLFMKVHFDPTMKNGKPIESYVRVPFTFSPDQPTPSAPPETTESSAPTSPSI